MAGAFFFMAWAVAAIATAALGCWFDWGSTLQAVALAFAWAAVATVLDPQLLTRMVFTVVIDGVTVAPTSGTGIIAGDAGELTTLTDSARQRPIDIAIQVVNEVLWCQFVTDAVALVVTPYVSPATEQTLEQFASASRCLHQALPGCRLPQRRT